MIITDSKTLSEGPSSPTISSVPSSPLRGDGQDPPPYAPSDSSSVDSAPIVNHLHISQHNSAVKGTWRLDPSLVIPPAFLPQVPLGEELQNMKIVSHNGSINAQITLVGQPTNQRATISTQSRNGAVRVVLNRTEPYQKFSLVVHSNNGAITVKIPRDFEGPVTFRNYNGSTKFSPAIESKLVHFNMEPRSGRAFIGNWQSAPGDLRYWDGDELDVGSHNGRIHVVYVDEKTDSEIFWDAWKSEGFLAAMGKWF